ncbi:hypothetical protein DER44DRAFT_791894 [Fusarium oxysporum]|nr:hypothetical protein DER44DRAFT_791894 [Fusarium oxysporum]
MPSTTYDHTCGKVRDPVCSPLVKLARGGLVVGSETTSEYLLLIIKPQAFFADAMQ